MRFLEQHVADADPLVAAVASTERALALVGRGGRSHHEVVWDRDAAPVRIALLAADPPGSAEPGDFIVRVSHDLPALLAVYVGGGRRSNRPLAIENFELPALPRPAGLGSRRSRSGTNSAG
jgi:hypothetical protein